MKHESSTSIHPAGHLYSIIWAGELHRNLRCRNLTVRYWKIQIGYEKQLNQISFTHTSSLSPSRLLLSPCLFYVSSLGNLILEETPTIATRREHSLVGIGATCVVPLVVPLLVQHHTVLSSATVVGFTWVPPGDTRDYEKVQSFWLNSILENSHMNIRMTVRLNT